MTQREHPGVIGPGQRSRPNPDVLSGLRVGVDMDGVIVDFERGWMSRYNAAFGAALEPSMVTSWGVDLTRLTHFESKNAFWKWARSERPTFFRDAPAFPGAIETLARIATRHRLCIVSSKLEWSIPDAYGWIGDSGLPVRETHFLKDKSLARCHVYLDDAPHQLEALRANAPDAVICRMVRPWNAPLAGVRDIDSWPRFEALVEAVALAQRPG